MKTFLIHWMLKFVITSPGCQHRHLHKLRQKGNGPNTMHVWWRNRKGWDKWSRRAKIQEDEASMEALARELAAVTEQIQGHKAEDVRRVREAKPQGVEKVTSDMDVEGGSNSGEEVGVNFEAGKKGGTKRSLPYGCIFQGRTFSSLDNSDSV